jgi:uncharacterized protein YndB with AHSA1/START domain
MNDQAPIRVQVRHRFRAASERVFDAFLDPAMARRFLFATPTGEITRCEIDPRVGGVFVIVDRRPEGDAEHHGKFVELERPRRIVFQFSDNWGFDRSSLVTIDIGPLASGCEVTLTHDMLPEWKDYVQSVTEGWTGILEGWDAALR